MQMDIFFKATHVYRNEDDKLSDVISVILVTELGHFDNRSVKLNIWTIVPQAREIQQSNNMAVIVYHS